MKRRLLTLIILCSGILYSCGGAAPSSPPSSPLSSPAANKSTGLFLETEDSGTQPLGAEIERFRFVKINSGLLLDDAGQARGVQEITLNLFPDVTYVGVIEQVEQDGDGYSWNGTLKGVENSTMFIVYTSGIFIVHAASPEGVYEVSSAGDDLYRAVKIDQTKLQGGGQD